MGTIVNLIRPFIAPFVVPWVGAALAYLQFKFGIVYEPEAAAKITEGVVLAVCLIFASAASFSGVVKVFVNKWLNPANALRARCTRCPRC